MLLEQVGGVSGAEYRRVGWQRVMCRLACGSMCRWDKIWPLCRTTKGRVPKLRVLKIVYDVWNFFEPT